MEEKIMDLKEKHRLTMKLIEKIKKAMVRQMKEEKLTEF